MKLEDVRIAYQNLTGTASQTGRVLALAGIAVIWIFRSGEGIEARLPNALVLPLGLFATGLALDFLHYLVGGAIWGAFGRIKEKEGISEDRDFDAPPALNWPMIILFWLKAVSVVAGYVLLTRFLWQNWKPCM
ncbi:MAG: hypothetical protein WBD75_07105 [Phycisphaerae bacterium]